MSCQLPRCYVPVRNHLYSPNLLEYLHAIHVKILNLNNSKYFTRDVCKGHFRMFRSRDSVTNSAGNNNLHFFDHHQRICLSSYIHYLTVSIIWNQFGMHRILIILHKLWFQTNIFVQQSPGPFPKDLHFRKISSMVLSLFPI